MLGKHSQRHLAGLNPRQAQTRPELIGGETGEAAAQAVELDVHALGLTAGDDEAGRHTLELDGRGQDESDFSDVITKSQRANAKTSARSFISQ